MRRALLVVAAVFLATACQSVSSQKIQAWKTSPEGAARLVAAVKDVSVALNLRVEAASALAAAGLTDRMEEAISGLPIDERARLIPPLVPAVAVGLIAADAAAASAARDALFLLRQQATTEEATRSIDGVLFPALERDLRTDRVGGSGHSLQEILIAIGRPALPLVLKSLDDPKVPFALGVEVVQKVGDRVARQAAGGALVRRARARPPEAAPLWTALATLGGPDVIAYLGECVQAGGAAADAAAEAMVKLHREPSLLPVALRMVGNPATSSALRERMLEVAQNIGGVDAWQGLLKLVPTAPDQTAQFRLYQAALKAGGGAALRPALEALPAGAVYRPSDVREQLVKPLTTMGMDIRTGLFEALESRAPLARLVVLWTLEHSAYKTDAQFVVKLVKDNGAIKGLPGSSTVGKEAARITEFLRKLPD